MRDPRGEDCDFCHENPPAGPQGRAKASRALDRQGNVLLVQLGFELDDEFVDHPQNVFEIERTELDDCIQQ